MYPRMLLVVFCIPVFIVYSLTMVWSVYLCTTVK